MPNAPNRCCPVHLKKALEKGRARIRTLQVLVVLTAFLGYKNNVHVEAFQALKIFAGLPGKGTLHNKNEDCYFDRYYQHVKVFSVVNGDESNDGGQDNQRGFFIRPALVPDLPQASDILADAFIRHRTGFITFQLEKLNVFLSLESTYPYRDGVPRKHAMFAACRSTDGKVIGFCEVDDEPRGTFKNELTDVNNGRDIGEIGRKNGSVNSSTGAPRPYMCNLAVDRKWRGKGVAKALIQSCEEKVLSDEWSEITNARANNNKHNFKLQAKAFQGKNMYLKVRSYNKAALHLYRSLGYRECGAIYLEEAKSIGEDHFIITLYKTLSSLDDESSNMDDTETLKSLSSDVKCSDAEILSKRHGEV